MKIRSILHTDHIFEDDLATHECSDRIWVPRRMFERWMAEEDAGTIVTLQLDEVYGCMYAPHSGPHDTLYVPNWMCRALRTPEVAESKEDDTDDYIVPIRCRPEVCMFLKVQPHTSEHIINQTESPEDVLARGFDAYTCINEGQTISLRLESGLTMDVTIMEAHPANKRPLCIRAGEIALELMAPFDIPDPDPEPEPVVARPPTPPVPEEPEIPKPLTRDEISARRERMAAAAMARFSSGANASNEN